MTITIYTDASSQRNGMGYAWLAVNQIGITIAQGTVRIPSQLNPNYGSTTAEAIGLAIAKKETEHIENREFHSDSQSLVLMLQGKSHTQNQQLTNLLHIIGKLTVKFDNTSNGIKTADKLSKRAIIGQTQSSHKLLKELQKTD